LPIQGSIAMAENITSNQIEEVVRKSLVGFDLPHEALVGLVDAIRILLVENGNDVAVSGCPDAIIQSPYKGMTPDEFAAAWSL
jgi:hypothetical protein